MTDHRQSNHYNKRAPLRLRPFPRPETHEEARDSDMPEDWIHEWNQPTDGQPH